MKATSFTALAVVALACVAFAPRAVAEVAGGPPAPQEKTPEQLIEQLRSDDFDQRRDAAARLEKMGDAARASVERAAKEDDPDVRASAVKILARLLKATLQIHLVDYEGKPLADTAGEVTLATSDSAGVAQAPANAAAEAEPKPIAFRTNADGVASLKLESTGQIRLQVKIPGFVDDNSETTVDARAGENIALVAVKRGATASGIVLGADGKPLKDAQVSLVNPGSLNPALLELQLLNVDQSPLEGKEAVTDQDGKWRLENVSDGVYAICVKKADGHLPALSAPFRLHEGEAKDTGQIALKARTPGKLKAALKGKLGQPLSKFNVSISLTPFHDEKSRAALQMEVPYRQEQKESDEHGVVELDDLSPGKYRLVIVGQTEGPDLGVTLADSTVEIKAGETAPVEAKAPEKGGSIKGHILFEDEKGTKGIKGMSVAAVCEHDFALYGNAGGAANAPIVFRGFPDGMYQTHPGVTDGVGVYRIGDLRPGKYVLIFGNDEDGNALPGYVFGVEVKSDARTEAPDAVFKRKVAPVTVPQNITGRALAAAGGPLVSAEIHLVSSAGDSSTASDEEGNFTFAQTTIRSREHAPREYLIIRHAGYKPLVVQEPFQPHQDYRLEKQEYGALRVTVTDEANKPVSGAVITPLASTVSTDLELQPAQPLKGVTNSKGFVRMTGLAAGKRELLVQAPGYFLPEKNAEAEVVANDERELTLALHSGYRVTGRVTLPPRTAKREIIVTMDDSRNVVAGPDGAFAFDVVLPGEHEFIANAASMGLKRAGLLKLPRDPQKYKTESVLLEMQPDGGLAVDCGKDFAGRHVSLMPLESLSELDDRTTTNLADSDVDADGRAEFLDIVPGQYLLSLGVRDTAAGYLQKVSAEPLAGPFEVNSIGARADIATLPAVKAVFMPGTAKINAHIDLAGEHIISTEQTNVTITLKIRSDRAIAETTLSDSISTLSQPPAMMPLIVGTPPEGFKPRVPGSFEVESLPAGSYKIFAALNYYTFDESDSENQTQTQQTGKYKQIGVFTINDGEKLDLGELKFEPDEIPDPAKPAEFLKTLLRPLDRAQDFEP
ncbi:MAG TPA: hypothetical protein VKX17_09150 [Planctomycetota bacterium]|nr:hypothetical protein [Planctomycetota bacterium]